MDDIEELLEAFLTLYASLEKLRQLEGPEFLLPGRVDAYHDLLEDAYVTQSIKWIWLKYGDSACLLPMHQ